MPYPHQFIKLTDEERTIVKAEIQRYGKEGKVKKRAHIQILYFSDQGQDFQSIAVVLSLSYPTVRRWIYLYRKEGLKPFVGR
ncbi:MAG: helix-turn-helix domain-containing protein [Planctomycetota bacterium]